MISGRTRTLGGLGMLAYQGARSFKIWTGKRPSVEVMIEAAQARFRAADPGAMKDPPISSS